MTEKTLASPKPSETSIANNFKKAFRQCGGILSRMVVLVTLFNFINNSFFIANNTTNITLQVSIIAITVYGMTYVLLLGDIGLSAGSTIALVGALAAFGASWGIPFVLSVLLSITAALTLGMVDGGLTAIAGIPSSAVTVATMGVFRDIAYIVTDGMPIMIEGDALPVLGNGESLCIPIPIWILIISSLINHFIPTKTTFGRKTYITGGDKEVAIYSGINVIRSKTEAFMITVVLTGISGMILASCLYPGQPNSASSYELDVIAAAILGGTSLNGGYGTMVETVIGALTIGVINNGMNLMNVPYLYQMMVKGLATLVAVYFDVRSKGKRS